MKRRILVLALVLGLIPVSLSELSMGNREKPANLPGDLSERSGRRRAEAFEKMEPFVLAGYLTNADYKFGIPFHSSHMLGTSHSNPDREPETNGDSYFSSSTGNDRFGFNPLVLSRVSDVRSGGMGGSGGSGEGDQSSVNPPLLVRPIQNRPLGPDESPLGPTPVSEPTTIFLLSSGLLSVVFGRKRFLKDK